MIWENTEAVHDEPAHDEPSLGVKAELERILTKHIGVPIKVIGDDYLMVLDMLDAALTRGRPIVYVPSETIPKSEIMVMDTINFSMPMTLPAKNKVKITHLKLPEPIYLDKGVTLSLINARARAIK
jgi:hypothetical protein